jgi:hypothetical protein
MQSMLATVDTEARSGIIALLLDGILFPIVALARLQNWNRQRVHLPQTREQ